jgi:hypothetical protein
MALSPQPTASSSPTTAARTSQQPLPPIPELDWRNYVVWGRGLRFLLVDALMARPSMSVAELATVLADHGYHVAGRPSKVISDALRWEVRRGRVERLGRGVYRYRGAPVSTARRIRLFAALCLRWRVATTRTGVPLPVPDARPGVASRCGPGPTEPPWFRIGWLWGA